jgi:beta-hydroxylase
MFADLKPFPFVEDLEERWRDVLGELEALGSRTFIPWIERHGYSGRWDMFPLLVHGREVEENCRLCPRTAALAASIPRVNSAGFSWLGPHSHIKPHRGHNPALVNCHLGLIIPQGCRIRAGAEIRTWTPGGCLAFHDCEEHEVWNDADEPRVILLADLYHPEMPGEVPRPTLEQTQAMIRMLREER